MKKENWLKVKVEHFLDLAAFVYADSLPKEMSLTQGDAAKIKLSRLPAAVTSTWKHHFSRIHLDFSGVWSTLETFTGDESLIVDVSAQY